MKQEKFNTAEINASVNIVDLVSRYAPLKKQGKEFVGLCLFHADNTPSMTVSEEKGFVHCFSCGAHHDPISFLMAVEGIEFVEACKRLNDGSPSMNPAVIAQRETVLKKAPPRITCPPPEGTAKPDMRVKGLGGEPSQTWEYLTPEGALWGIVARYEHKGKKTIRCWTWGSRAETDPPAWACGHFTTPRPLYGLHELAQRPTAQVLIVEGEKAADAGTRLFPAMVCITWPGGAQSADYADWSALKGRKVVLLPDNDEPGTKAMLRIAKLLHAAGAAEIKGTTPGTQINGTPAPDGWDIADAPPETTPDEALIWAKANIFVYPQTLDDMATEAANLPHADEIPITAYSDADTASQAADTPEPLPTQPNPIPATINGNPTALAMTDKGGLIMNLDNAVRAIELEPDLKGHIWYDEFLDAIITDWQGPRRQWKDADDIKLCLFLQRHVGLSRISTNQAHDAATVAAFHDTRNQCRDWLESLEWDETQRVEWLLSDGFGTTHDSYSQAVGRCWMVSMVARVMRPGCKVDTVPVLEGGQGIGKSSALSILGGEWFVEGHESVMSKDFFGVLNGHMLVEISEMHSFTRAEVERIKGIISCQVDRYRKAYGRNTEDHPRHTVLVCTTNRDDWQRDETGARRFWPVACGHINLEWIRENREQLFAEAVYLYKNGGKWWDVPDAEQKAQVDSRRDVDSWEHAIEQWLTDSARTRVQVGDILSDCLNIEVGKHDVLMQRRVGRALRALGWSKKVRREPDGKQCKIWMPED